MKGRLTLVLDINYVIWNVFPFTDAITFLVRRPVYVWQMKNPLNEELLSDNDSCASDTELLLLLLMLVCKFHVLIRSLPLGTDTFPSEFDC